MSEQEKESVAKKIATIVGTPYMLLFLIIFWLIWLQLRVILLSMKGALDKMNKNITLAKLIFLFTGLILSFVSIFRFNLNINILTLSISLILVCLGNMRDMEVRKLLYRCSNFLKLVNRSIDLPKKKKKKWEVVIKVD